MFLLCTLRVFIPPGVWAQEDAAAAENITGAAAGNTAGEEGGQTLPNQFRELTLGMGLDDLKTALEHDSMFNFRGDPDVSYFSSGRNESLIETSGTSFIKRAFFQLRDGALFIMAFTLNTGMTDHYSMFTTLRGKYGEPSSLDPRQAVWETEEIRLTLERPLTIKYIDKIVFDDIISEAALGETRRVQQQQEFLNEF